MFRPLQGHLQGARKLHSLHIQCFCLLSHLVPFHRLLLHLTTFCYLSTKRNYAVSTVSLLLEQDA
jgi:hypothetical protein